MTGLEFLLGLVGLALGAGGVRLAQVIRGGLRERRQLNLQERRQEHEIEGDKQERSESVEEAVERMRIGVVDAARRDNEAKDAQIAKLTKDLNEQGSALGNEKERRRKAERERNEARDEHKQCAKRLDDLQAQVDALQAQMSGLVERLATFEACRMTCVHRRSCPVLTH